MNLPIFFKSKYIPPIVAILVLFGTFFFLFRIEEERQVDVARKGKTTVCSVYDEGKRMIKIKYVINGNEYTNAVGKGYSNIEDGEEFLLNYDPLDPKSVVVHFDLPVLSEEYNYSQTACLSISKRLSILDFTYRVGDELIIRKAQFRGHSLNNSDYVVKYRTENPQIGYLIKE